MRTNLAFAYHGQPHSPHRLGTRDVCNRRVPGEVREPHVGVSAGAAASADDSRCVKSPAPARRFEPSVIQGAIDGVVTFVAVVGLTLLGALCVVDVLPEADGMHAAAAETGAASTQGAPVYRIEVIGRKSSETNGSGNGQS